MQSPPNALPRLLTRGVLTIVFLGFFTRAAAGQG
jgi:hypothetical protein